MVFFYLVIIQINICVSCLMHVPKKTLVLNCVTDGRDRLQLQIELSSEK